MHCAFVFIDFLGNYTTIAFMIWDPISVQEVAAKNYRSFCKATGQEINSKTEFHLVVIPSRLHFKTISLFFRTAINMKKFSPVLHFIWKPVISYALQT